jgi:hypothetical protein
LQPTVATHWDVNTDMLLRKGIDLPAGTSGVRVSIAVDNDANVYWNGTLVGSATHGGCPSYNDYEFSVPDSLLVAGSNVLAIQAIDTGVESFVDASVSTQRSCSTIPASSSLADEFGAIVCGYAADELAAGNAAARILGATSTLPHVFQIGTTNVWIDPATGELTTNEEKTIETNTEALGEAVNAATSGLQDMAAEKIASRITGGEIPCAVSAVKDLADANNSDVDAAIQFAKATQTLHDLVAGSLDASASLGVIGYDYAGAKALIDKLSSLSDAMNKDAAGCFQTEASLAAEFAAAAQEETIIEGEVEVAFNQIGLVSPGGALLLGPVGPATGIPVIVDPNEFSLPTSQLPAGLPSGATLEPGTLTLLTLGANTINAGTLTTATVSGFAPFSTGQFVLGSTPVRLATFATDSTGSFSGPVQIPKQTTPGKHELYAVASAPDGAVRTLGAPITVNAGPGQPQRPECIGTLSGTIDGALTVAPGLVCTLTNAIVNGRVTVSAGAVFEADSSTLHGGVTASSPLAFALCGDRVRGAVTIGSSVLPPLIGSADSPGCAPTTIAGK